MASVVPVIDFSDGQLVPPETNVAWETTPGQISLANEIIAALKTVGFVCLINTGIDQTEMDSLINEVKRFFHLENSIKSGYTKAVMGNTGWTDVGREVLNNKRMTGDFKETFNFQPLMSGDELPESMQMLKLWWSRLSSLSLQFMKLMGLGLGLADVSYIADSHSFGSPENESAIRVNFYPHTSSKDLAPGQVRCGEHSDYGSVTLLVQDSPGLEVMNRATGVYEPVVAPPGGIIVNIGDMMQHWTSDTLIANSHRVLVAEEKDLQETDRVSIPFFAQPDRETRVQCLLGDDKYLPVVMKDWLRAKIDAAFADRRS